MVEMSKEYRTLTTDEEKTKLEIIKYLLTHKNEVNYSERIFKKLEGKLSELIELKGGI